ncbi:DNA repair protein XRCC4 isoform X2 [Cucurbita maxima]|uniref:DNA repair protein XRCC4 isoform X2 n=1 Tax=Cucurbita maxima TaxID=3661 RepID=A0A6J1I3G3_CUCMA|nr:DNA repair protein XRCC4 isoform X2 [Cucurbita maxima]
MDAIRHTCLKLEVPTNAQPDGRVSIFVKGTWYQHRFDLSITDGLNAWTCHATEDEVRLRAEQWDQEPSDYVGLAERYLGFQQPDSVYDFADVGNGDKREEVVRKTQSFEKLKVESEKCLAQSERICEEKVEFETALYAKFLNVLNTKKAKLREYRDQFPKQTTTSSKLKQDDEYSDKTESFDDDSDAEKN